MILTDATTTAITRARQFVEGCRRQQRLLDAWRDVMGLHASHDPGSAGMYLMQVALDFAEATVELADGTAVARAPTDHVLLAVTKARNLVQQFQPGAHISLDDARSFAEAVVALAGARPNKVDAARVDRGDYERAAGDALCASCGSALHDHPVVPGIEWLRRRCDGKLVKL
jgi:hypothetical protein